ncbi:hypothetical protein HI914_04148 [Erysiphe necator]|uniref:Acid phosphatase-like protein n=1 Tax=Uncinula necator TaxID=52586 RepID=A0A0B1P3G6_UNCNE|nr:hypothetical protein HI914_04148 [Erysiphe necator]KHJ32783.1 hypothetical protein EV44_g0015 [Erysiphe necator]
MSRISGAGAFFLTAFLLTIFTCTGWLIYTQLRARRLGIPTPTLSSYNPFGNKNDYRGPDPAHGGFVGWVRDRVRIFKHRKAHSSTGGFDESFNNSIRDRARNQGFSPLDPDEAWDTRVEAETGAFEPREYYEEQEFGRHRISLAPSDYEEIRGRTRNRDSDKVSTNRKLDEEMGRSENPFVDAAELQDTSLRDISPRPFTAV